MTLTKKYFLAFLFIITFFLFKNSFQINFFSDDFFFLQVSRISSVGQFLNFFNPAKDYFFRPIPTELFYFIIHIFRESTFIAKLIVFSTFFAGIYFVYQSLIHLTKNKLLARLTVFLYAIHFSHVFQLYWLATFQEVALLAFLASSFYSHLRGRYTISLALFIGALLSKEIALMFPLFIGIISLVMRENFDNKKKLQFGFLFITAIGFFLLYKSNLSHVAQIDTYAINLSPKLLINNLMWYLLFGLGFANFLPNYMTSIFSKPLPDFWKLFNIQDFRIYLPFLMLFWIVFSVFAIIYFNKNKKEVKNMVLMLLFSLTSFLIFILPALPILHRWMVRLTVPLIFISFGQAYILSRFVSNGGFFKKVTFLLISLYFAFNYFGIRLHENSSLYLLESRFVASTQRFFDKEREKIKKYSILLIRDRPPGQDNPWGGSEKLKVTYHDQSFIDHFMKGSKIRTIYDRDYIDACPWDAYVVSSEEILENKGVAR